MSKKYYLINSKSSTALKMGQLLNTRIYSRDFLTNSITPRLSNDGMSFLKLDFNDNNKIERRITFISNRVYNSALFREMPNISKEQNNPTKQGGNIRSALKDKKGFCFKVRMVKANSPELAKQVDKNEDHCEAKGKELWSKSKKRILMANKFTKKVQTILKNRKPSKLADCNSAFFSSDDNEKEEVDNKSSKLKESFLSYIKEGDNKSTIQLINEYPNLAHASDIVIYLYIIVETNWTSLGSKTWSRGNYKGIMFTWSKYKCM